MQLILHELGISLPHEDGFSKVKNAYIQSAYSASVMIMVLMQMKHGCMGIGFIQQIMLFLVMKYRLQKGLHQTTLHDGS